MQPQLSISRETIRGHDVGADDTRGHAEEARGPACRLRHSATKDGGGNRCKQWQVFFSLVS